MAPVLDPEFLEQHESSRLEPSVAKDILAGTVGGIAQVLSGQPFDTTKVRLQSAPDGTYTGALDVVRKLLRDEGPLAFYKGTLLPLIGVGACVSTQFTVNEGMKRYFATSNDSQVHLTYPQLYSSGMAAGLATSFLASPIEQVRIRLQVQNSSSPNQLRGPWDAIKKIFNGAGLFHGVYRGLVPTLIREGHGMGIYFLVAEACVQRDVHITGHKRQDIPSWRMCVYGGIAGIVMWLSVYPIDVIKSRMQTDAIEASGRRFSSVMSCFRDTSKSGLSGLFKGFSPTMLRAAPVNACTFLGFELTRRALG